MTALLPTAAYVQNHELLRAHADRRAALESIRRESEATHPGLSQRVWELLETPQTIDSLARVLANEFAIEPEACVQDVEVSLTRLYREDLIQVSPDS